MPRRATQTASNPTQVGQPSGLLTTEFWKSLIFSGISVATGLGAIGPNVPTKYKPVIDSAAFLAASLCLIGYAISRGITKAATIKATAVVNSAVVAKMPSEQVVKQAAQKP